MSRYACIIAALNSPVYFNVKCLIVYDIGVSPVVSVCNCHNCNCNRFVNLPTMGGGHGIFAVKIVFGGPFSPCFEGFHARFDLKNGFPRRSRNVLMLHVPHSPNTKTNY